MASFDQAHEDGVTYDNQVNLLAKIEDDINELCVWYTRWLYKELTIWDREADQMKVVNKVEQMGLTMKAMSDTANFPWNVKHYTYRVEHAMTSITFKLFGEEITQEGSPEQRAYMNESLTLFRAQHATSQNPFVACVSETETLYSLHQEGVAAWFSFYEILNPE